MPTRVRTRSGPTSLYTGPTSRYKAHSPDAVWYTNNGADRPMITWGEVFKDLPGPKAVDKPCYHYKWNYVDQGLNGYQSNDWNEVVLIGPGYMTTSRLPSVPTIPADKMASYADQLVQQWTSSPPPDVSVAQNLAELKQTIGLITQAKRLITHYVKWSNWRPIAGLLRDINDMMRSAHQRKGDYYFSPRIKANLLKSINKLDRLGKGAPRDIAGAYLAWSFGVAPLISDCKKLPGIVKRTEEKLRALQKGNLAWKRHRLNRDDVHYVAPTSVPTSCGAHSQFTLMTSFTASVALSVDVRTNYSGLQQAIDELAGQRKKGLPFVRAMAHATGFTSLPLLAWELFPWSFAVDWCYDIGSYVSRWSPGLVPGHVEVKNPITSVKRRVDYKVIHGNYVPSYTHAGVVYQNFFVQQGSGKCEIFERSCSLPSLNPSPGGLTPGQQTLLAALLTQLLYKA